VGAERRRHARTRKRLRVLYGENDLSKVGFTRDISAGGVFILCNGPLPTGNRLHVQVFLNEKDFLLLEGMRVHTKQVPPSLRPSSEQGFGVRFLSPMEALTGVAPAAEQMAAGVVAASPSNDRPIFSVEYQDLSDLKNAWLRELRHGGIFVPTARPLERDQPVTIKIRLAFVSLNLEVAGKVLQAIGAPTPGLSLEFADRRVLQVLAPFVS
jgi:Tfp pilus assembly protein PilZ